MREFWVSIEEKLPEGLKSSILKTANASSVAVVVCSGKDLELAKSSGLKAASTIDGDIRILEEPDWGKAASLRAEGIAVCVNVRVLGRDDEDRALKAAESDVEYLLISCPDWKVIPLENLIAKMRGKTRLLAEVASAEEAQVALETLELGVDGIVLEAQNPMEVEETAKVVSTFAPMEERERIPIVPAKVVRLKQLSLGHRVCIDTCDILEPSEGMLVGCQSSGLFLVQAEVQENPHVEPRPFRVNAGPVSLYILTPGNKTRYLSELRAGDEVLVVNREGLPRSVVVARVKIEKRPFMLVEAEIGGVRLKTVAQNAETICFMTEKGSKPVTELREGDEVLIHNQYGGRHFGVLVSEESVIER